MSARILALGLDILFPPRCPGCRAAAPLHHVSALRDGRGTIWCERCLPFVRTPAPACPRCAQPHLPWLDLPARSGLCDGCLADPPPWRWARCAFEMSGPPRAAIHRAKAAGGAWVCHALGAALGDVERPASRSPGRGTAVFVPIPLHPADEARRGFNQAVELARSASAQGPTQLADVLERTRRNRPQKELGRALRRQNVADVFRASPAAAALNGHRVILLDDVITTTSTLRAACDALQLVGIDVEGVIGLCREP